jgi:CRP-like cAMP-binding protein
MSNPLALKLGRFIDLSPDDLAVLDDWATDPVPMRARQDLIKEGDRPETVFLLLEGWACRYKVLRDGRRQIMAYLLPGDLCDPHIFILKEMDHNLGLLSDAQVARIPKRKIIEATDHRPAIARALWWSTLVDEGVLREWLVNIGQRTAFDRIAHLFVELYLRLREVGLVEGTSFTMPVTQEDLGDTMGLTSVHVNRMLQQMGHEGLIERDRKRLYIPDVARLMDVAQFQSNYLHLNRRERRGPAAERKPDAT